MFPALYIAEGGSSGSGKSHDSLRASHWMYWAPECTCLKTSPSRSTLEAHMDSQSLQAAQPSGDLREVALASLRNKLKIWQSEAKQPMEEELGSEELTAWPPEWQVGCVKSSKKVERIQRLKVLRGERHGEGILAAVHFLYRAESSSRGHSFTPV